MWRSGLLQGEDAMSLERTGLGIDVGSVSVAVALVGADRSVLWSRYAFHKGDVKETLARILANMPAIPFQTLATTSGSKALESLGLAVHDGVLCAIEASGHISPERRSLFLVGGERFYLIRFHEDGSYRDTRSNTSCAAGTGSFLDQQAQRLGLSDAKELAGIAAGNQETPPTIASRCSVFAKTDLIHAQQEGYGLAQICAGLSSGVARNIVDTVVGKADIPRPAFIAGGVALNGEVVRHLSKQTGCEVQALLHAEILGAVGAASLSLEGRDDRFAGSSSTSCLEELKAALKEERQSRTYVHAPLMESGESRPGNGHLEASSTIGTPRLLVGTRSSRQNPVEVENFDEGCGYSGQDVYVGLDIGSTSSKAVLLGDEGKVLVGLYTRTAGRPLEAMQALFEAISVIESERGKPFHFIGAGTTGSGRKLVGSVIGADLILDEITAHARTATEIDPDTDTIIEIGGQDSKFTTLRRGIVTFSHMNTVCAAGTGSFIEEQAAKLGVPLLDVAGRALSTRAPRTSDRCTVFMEREINHLLVHGYSVDEILAAVLYSIVDNYLNKVATLRLIGERICFQGATARNAALVAAFRKKLNKPIQVSKYCHLAGALGVALTLHDGRPRLHSSFKGLDLWRDGMSARTEICALCANACKLRIVRLGGQDVAYGLTCGRDYGEQAPSRKRDGPLDVVQLRRGRYARESRALPPLPERKRGISIGIPYSLHLVNDAEFWKRFFAELGVEAKVSGPEAGRDGRRLARAEFCAPIADLHGHVASLLRRVDYVFLPHQLRIEGCGSTGCAGYPSGEMCYYTQYAPTLMKAALGHDARIISPLVGGADGNRGSKNELMRALGGLLDVEPRELMDAYERAHRFYVGVQRMVAENFLGRTGRGKNVEVVLVGRPYTILSSRMNRRIPGLLAGLDVPVWVQDEIPEEELARTGAVKPLEMKDLTWSYALRMLCVARYAASREGLYPILISSFRCSPDAFVIDAFREILDAEEKPYLILQVDDLDSAVGYETRIEAGIRAFRNHLHSQQARGRGSSSSRESAKRYESSTAKNEGIGSPAEALGRTREAVEKSFWSPIKSLWGGLGFLRDKTLLVPCWDSYVCQLLVEMFRHRGVDARLLDETPELISRAMRHNSGQCIPVNVVAEECVEYMRRHQLEPSNTALWVLKSRWACNIPMYPSFLRRLLDVEGLEELQIYRGMVTFSDVDLTAPIEAYFAFLLGGMLRRFGCMIRPYEDEPGATDAALEQCLELFRKTFRAGLPKDAALKEATRVLDGVAKTVTSRPKVGIFGDFYVRDNDVFNQGLIREIEIAGGEVVTTPYSEYARVISSAHFKRLLLKGNYKEWTTLRTLLGIMESLEDRYRRRLAKPYSHAPSVNEENLDDALNAFGMRIEQSGETFENVLKVLHICRSHSDVSLLIQVNPAFCCPALVTEAMTEKIESVTGVPVVCITYDGTASSRNHVVRPYLKHARKRGVLRRVG